MIPHSKPWLDTSDIQAVQQTLASGFIARGQQVTAFEQAVAQYHHVPHAVATSSGTAALILALKALEIGPGQEVILPAYVCHQVRDAILHVGAKPILTDVGDRWVMTAEHVAPHITSNTAAIIVVHSFGFMADVASFTRFGVPVIEDACQAFGAANRERKAGSVGTIGILSFHATKCLSTGEGGMVLCHDAALATKLQTLITAAPMSDIAAALGLNQLRRYDDFLRRRAALATHYHSELAGLPVTLPHLQPGEIFFRYPLRVAADIEGLIARFGQEGIHVRRGVDRLLHAAPSNAFPNAQALYNTTLSLPLYPALTDSEQETVIAACRKIFA